MAITSLSESTRLGPIGEVTSGTESDTEAAVFGVDSATNEPSIEKTPRGSITDSVRPAERRAGGVISRSTDSGTSSADAGKIVGDATGGSCFVLTSQCSTTTWTALSTVRMMASVEESTNCTSSLVEVPRETAMRGAG